MGERMIGDLCLPFPWHLQSCLGLWDPRVSGNVITSEEIVFRILPDLEVRGLFCRLEEAPPA